MSDKPLTKAQRRRALDAMRPDLASCASEGDIASMFNRLRRNDVALVIAQGLERQHHYANKTDGQYGPQSFIKMREEAKNLGYPDYHSMPEEREVTLKSDPAPSRGPFMVKLKCELPPGMDPVRDKEECEHCADSAAAPVVPTG